MKYSIIVPVYNGEDFISERLKSLLSYPQENYEIIVVDDGSSDKTLEVLENIKETSEKLVVISQENSGPSGARNTGLNNARGEFILFADADDILNLEILEYLSKVEENFDLYIFNYLIDNGNQISSKKLNYNHELSVFEKEEILSLYLDGLLHTLWNKVYRKEIIDEHDIRFDETVRMGEDLVFNLNYLKYTEEIIFSSSPFYTYSEESIGSVSKELPVNYFDNQLFLINQVVDFFEHGKKLTDKKHQKKIYADFMKNVSNYIKKAVPAYDQKAFTQLMIKNLFSKESRAILNKISFTQLTHAHKVLLLLIKAKQFKVIYNLYSRSK